MTVIERITIEAKLIDHKEHYESVVRCAHGIAEAAEMLGVSETTIRRAAKRLGVKRIAGRVVAGFVRFRSSPVDVSMPYSK